MPPSNDHIQARGQAGPDHLPPDLGWSGNDEISRPVYPRRRQEHNGSGAPRRPLCDPGKGTGGLEGGRAALRAGKDLMARYLGV